MRADLQRFFNLTLDRIGSDFSAYHACSCLACLPYDSALIQAIGEDMRKAEYVKQTGLDTQSIPIDQFNDWYENSHFKEVDKWPKTL